MPYSMTFAAAQKRVVVNVTRPVSEQEAMTCLQQLRSHPEFQTDYGILVDLVQVDLPPSGEEAVRLARAMKQLFPGQKIAIVWPNVETIRPLLVLWVVASPEVHVKIFATQDDAARWLGNSSDTATFLIDHD